MGKKNRFGIGGSKLKKREGSTKENNGMIVRPMRGKRTGIHGNGASKERTAKKESMQQVEKRARRDLHKNFPTISLENLKKECTAGMVPKQWWFLDPKKKKKNVQLLGGGEMSRTRDRN